MIVVDSSAWIPYFHGVENHAVRLLDSIEDTTTIAVGDLVLLEVLQGARSDRSAYLIESELREFHVVAMLDDAVAVASAQNYRILRALGITVRKTPDLIIATFCIAGGHQLLHQDRDFSHFETHLELQVLR